MPRNGSGTYSLPAGNPVVSGTTIQASWANSTLADISTELTGSLARSGAGGMLGALRGVDGTVSVPAFSFTGETTSGFYRAGTGDVRFSMAGADIYTVTPTAVTFAVNPVLSAGTANGVLYLNGSKVVTSGTGLVFDGTSLGVGTSSIGSGTRLEVRSASTITDSRGILAINSTNAAGANLGGSISFGGETGQATTPYVFGAISGRYEGSGYAGYLQLSTTTSGGVVTERARIDASGNLGIGTASPSYQLQVQGTGQETANLTDAGNKRGSLYLQATAVGVGSGGAVLFGTTFGNATPFAAIKGFVLDGTSNTRGDLTFSTRNATGDSALTERMRLDSSGNLGLGVTPSAWNAFWKNIQVTSASFGGSGAIVNYATMASNIFSDGASYLSNAKYIASGTATAYIQNTGQHQWFTAPSGTAGNAISFTQAMTLDASGRLLIGATSGSSTISGTAAYAELSNSNLASLGLNNTTGRKFEIASLNTGALSFYDSTASTERARITSGGALLVGTSAVIGGASDLLQVSVTGAGNRAALLKNSDSPTGTSDLWNTATTGDNVFSKFFTEAAATLRGSIDYNRAGGLVRYNTTSDYRAKDIIGPVQDPGATIDALKVYEGKMKGATQSRPMLIAHEAQEHVPFCVSGEKDEENEDGTPKFQQMDHASLVPLLLAEIQSLRARVAALEAA